MERISTSLTLLGSLIAGAIVGVLGTVVQQAVLWIGTIGIPWGIVLAFAAVIFFLMGMRMYFESRWPAICGLIGILAISLVALIETPGGSVLVPANTYGTIWSAAPGIIGAIVVAWPRLTRSGRADSN